MRKIGQVYYKKGQAGTTRAQLISGSIFDDIKIVQLTIQAPPGVKFYINGGLEPFVVRGDERYPDYGKYEIDLNEGIVITQLSFDKKTVSLIDEYLIVDYIYEE